MPLGVRDMSAVAERVRTDDGRRVVISLDDGVYEFIRLNWLERNRVVHSGIDVGDGAVEFQPMEFARALLEASSITAICDGQRQPLDASEIASCSVDTGDDLLACAIHVNRRVSVEVSERPGDAGAIEVTIAGRTFTLAPWTWGLRNQILARCLRAAGRQTKSVDAARFHVEMLAAMCLAIDGSSPPADWLQHLDANTGDRLVEAASSLANLDRERESQLVAAIRTGRPHDGVTMYTLCREFGWTPAQIREQRATDIDALLVARRAAMAERVDGPSGVGSRASTEGLQSLGGEETTIIFVDDEEKEARPAS